MTDPTDWLDTVHEAWGRNALAATINLRGRPQRLRADAIRRAEGWELAARGLSWQNELSAEVFTRVIKELVATGGDPPASPAQRALALAVLQGRAPDDLVQSTDALARRLAPSLDRQLARAPDDANRAGFQAFLAGVVAMLLLARVEVLRVRKELPPAAPGTPDVVGERLQAAFDCPRDEPARRADLLAAALDVGLDGAPPPAIPVLEALAYEDLPLGGDTLRRCVAAMEAVAAEPPRYSQLGIDDATAQVRDDGLAAVFGMIAIRTDDAALGGELTERVALALERLLARNLSPESRLATGLSAAGASVRTGRLDRADAILAALRSDLSSATAELRFAELEARIRTRCGDRVGASERLIDALDESGQAADLTFRRQAILTLIASWPVALDPDAGDPRPGRDGIESWIDEAERLIETASSPSIHVFRGQLMTALFSLGIYDRGARVRSCIDFHAWAGSPGFNQWSTDIEQWSALQAARASGRRGAPTDGAGGKDAVGLGLEGDFAAGAKRAQDDAEIAIARGLPLDAFTFLAIAAQLHRRAGDLQASVDAFDTAFDLLETDLRYIPYPELVITRLAAWPDRYLVAAFTALDAGRPEQALSFAETGRGRLVAGQLGTMGDPPIDAIASADWEQFRTLWRRIAAQAASDLYSSSDPSSLSAKSNPHRENAAPLVAQLTALRRQFASAGAPPQTLTPLTPPNTVSDTPARLTTADRPTMVLYSVITQDQLRLIKITTDGAEVIKHDRKSLRLVLDAVRAYSDQIRRAQNVEGAVRDLLPRLLAETGPQLEPALHQAIDGHRGGRLIWVPQGVLAALPIHALPLDGRHVCDAVAIIVAESLAAAGTALSPTQTINVRPLAIRGRPSGAAPTEGAGTLLPAGAGEHLVTSAEEFQAALRLDDQSGDGQQTGATLIHLDCHGMFDWRDPLASHLLLGGQFDLTIDALFDSITIDPAAIVILDSCDSGTIAQTDLNEGIGIPAGLLAAGARSVIASGWPVARLASVGACRKIIKSLTAGIESPEALRDATCWLRDATVGDVREDLAAVGHPYAEEIPDQDPDFLARRLDDPWLWAAFMHWGAPWRAAVPPG